MFITHITQYIKLQYTYKEQLIVAVQFNFTIINIVHIIHTCFEVEQVFIVLKIGKTLNEPN